MHEVPSFERYYEEKVFMSKKVENQESKKKIWLQKNKQQCRH